MENHEGKRKIFLIRHAESEYNAANAKLMKEVEGKEQAYIQQEVAKSKFNVKFIDCSISDEGKRQAARSSEILKDKNVTLVITSPLRRCLQTTQGLFTGHKSSPKIIVQPLLKEVMSSSCDIGRDIEEVKKEFPDFDFSIMDNLPDKHLWYINILANENSKQALLTDLYKKFPEKKDAVDNAAEFTVGKMLEAFPKEYEGKVDMNMRVGEAKKWLHEQAYSLPEGEIMAVVAHSRFLTSFFSKGYGPEGEFIGSRRFVNCEVFEYYV